MEKIICAAIWWMDYPIIKDIDTARPTNIITGIVFCGHRHHNCLHTMSSITGKADYEMGKSIQGFLTNKNRFVTREEGAKIHIANGGELSYSSKQLYSEDLY